MGRSTTQYFPHNGKGMTSANDMMMPPPAAPTRLPVPAFSRDAGTDAKKAYSLMTECPACGRRMQVKHLAYKHRCRTATARTGMDLELRAKQTEQRAQELFRKRMSSATAPPTTFSV